MNTSSQEPVSILDDNNAYRALIGSVTAPVYTPDLVPDAVVRYRTEVGQLLIEADITRGVLPTDLSSFADAHDYVDANMYLLDEEHPEPVLGSFYEWDNMDTACIIDHFNRVIEALDGWLCSGRQGKASDYLNQS